MYKFKLFLVFIQMVLFSALLKAQSGEIRGIIKDKKTKETIVGANVLIQGTQIGGSTDLDGKFSIPYLQQGTYNLVVSYISYKSIVIPSAHVTKEKPLELEIELEEDVASIKGVEVKGQRKNDSELSMISTIKSSNLIVNGISNQQIQKSQDRDASDVVKRIPGVTIMDGRFIIVRGLNERYNTVWLNNIPTPSTESDVRAFSFDIIPSSMLDNILVYKTAAPELAGDFAGAAIQIFTKNIPEKNGLSISFNGSLRDGTTFKDVLGYQGGKHDWMGYDDGYRALPVGTPANLDQYALGSNDTPVQIADKYWQLTQIGRSLNKVWSVDTSKAPFDKRFSLNFSRRFLIGKMSLGNITAFTYSNTFQQYNLQRATFGTYDTIYDQPQFFSKYSDLVSTHQVKSGLLHNWSLVYGNNQKLEFRNLFNQLGSSKTIFRDGLDGYNQINIRSWEMRYASRSIYSGQLGGQNTFKKEDIKINWNLGYSYAAKDEPNTRRIRTVRNSNEEDPHYGEYSIYLSNQASPDFCGILYAGTEENIYSGNLTYEQKIHFKNFTPVLKAGVFTEQKDRLYTIRQIGFVKTKKMTLDFPFLPIDSIFADTNINTYNGIKLDEATNPDDSYRAKNKLLCGFISFKIPIGARLNIYTGARLEKNLQELLSYDSSRLVCFNDTINILPSVNFSYDLTEKSLLRASYAMTLNRPEFREISPHVFYDFEQDASIRGDTNLQNAYINNFDLRYEFYPGINEMITFGVFYKEFIHPIESHILPSTNLEYTYKNAEGATNYGAEVDIRKSFASWKKKKGLLHAFKDFTIVGNVALIKSKIRFPEGSLEEDRSMQGQSPFIINTGIFYQNDSLNLMVSLLYNVIGKRITIVGNPYSDNPNVYEMPRNSLDLTISKQFGKHIQVKGGIQDILNQPVRFTETISFMNDTNEDGLGDTKAFRDQERYSFKPGRYFSLGVTLQF
ncbi:MAG: TonB-dependent receptor [Bacteroidota bacterium]